MRRHLFLAIAALLAIAGSTGSAHHPFDTYDLDREITVAGEVVRATYGEPHSFLHVRDVAADGKGVVWTVELKGVGTLRARGFTPETLRVGERVTLRGHPGRVAAARRLWLMGVVRDRDGWTWSAS